MLSFRTQKRCIGVLTFAYVALRIWSFSGAWGRGATFEDTQAYGETAHLPLFSLDFWTWVKPWGVPLLWRFLPGPWTTSVPLVQWAASVVAWLVLAGVIFRVFRHPLVKVAGFGLVLAFCLVPAVAVWDGALLSESPTSSLTALFLAALIVMVEKPSTRRVVFVLLLATMLAGVRTTTGYLDFFILVPTAILLRRRLAIALVLVAGAIAIGVMTYVTTNVRYWQVPYGEIIALRILHQPDATQYFVDRGMPAWSSLPDDIMNSRYPLSTFEDAAALQPFVPWFNAAAQSTYSRYLLSHPNRLIVDPLHDMPGMVSPSTSLYDLQGLPLQIYEAKGYRAPLPRFVSRILFPSSATLVFVWAGLLLLMMTVLALNGWARHFWLVPLLMVITAVPHGILVYVGSDTSIGRHALLMAVLLRLGVVVGTLCVLEASLLNPSLGRFDKRLNSSSS